MTVIAVILTSLFWLLLFFWLGSGNYVLIDKYNGRQL